MRTGDGTARTAPLRSFAHWIHPVLLRLPLLGTRLKSLCVTELFGRGDMLYPKIEKIDKRGHLCL